MERRSGESVEEWAERMWDTPIETRSGRGESFRVVDTSNPFWNHVKRNWPVAVAMAILLNYFLYLATKF